VVEAKEPADALAADERRGPCGIGCRRQQVVEAGGLVVATVVQRRGVSRSRRPGGSKAMSQPLDARSVMGSGKVAELVQACRQSSVEVVVFVGAITERQRETLSELTGCEIASVDLADGRLTR
jgi:hypothetical protein